MGTYCDHWRSSTHMISQMTRCRSAESCMTIHQLLFHSSHRKIQEGEAGTERSLSVTTWEYPDSAGYVDYHQAWESWIASQRVGRELEYSSRVSFETRELQSVLSTTELLDLHIEEGFSRERHEDEPHGYHSLMINLSSLVNIVSFKR